MVFMGNGTAGMPLIAPVANIGRPVKPAAAFFHKILTVLVTGRAGSAFHVAENDLSTDIFLLAVESGTGCHPVCGGDPVRYYVPASGGNGPDGIVAAFYHSQDIRICGFCIPGIYGHRDHECGEWAGEGTAGDREGQVFQIEAGAGEKLIIQ